MAFYEKALAVVKHFLFCRPNLFTWAVVFGLLNRTNHHNSFSRRLEKQVLSTYHRRELQSIKNIWEVNKRKTLFNNVLCLTVQAIANS